MSDRPLSLHRRTAPLATFAHVLRVALVGAMGAASMVRANVEADLVRCRNDIVRIGDYPRTPAEAYCLGLSHQFAINRRRDPAQAIEWLRRSAGQGYAPARAVLGYMLEQGIGAAKNPGEAFRWYEKSAAAGNDDGLINLGRAYERGIGVERNTARARENYERAAAMGSRVAREALAGLGSAPPASSHEQNEFARGSALYKAERFAEAAKVFRALADRGYAPAQLQIGSQHARGEGVARDAVVAAQWYRKSAAQGYAIAQNNLSGAYEYSEGVRENWTESFRWAKRSADQGNPQGLFLVGRAYQFGIAVPCN